MHIVFFSHYYAPEVNAPASRTSEHCRAWVKAGHDVTVVTCAPNHPAGQIYPGYRNRLYQTEMIDGVYVVRLWTFLAPNKGVVRRTFNYLSYLVAATMAVPFLKKADVFVSTSPQFFCGLAGLPARLLRRAPWVLEIRDIWPESIVTVGAMRKGIATRLLEGVEAFAYRQADRIVCVADSYVAHIGPKCGDASKISVIKNGVDLNLFRADSDGVAAKKGLGLEGRFVAAYVGTHGMAHGLETILDAAALLKSDRRIAFLLVGDGAERERLEQMRRERGLDNVVIAGQRPKSEMPAIWAATDVSLIVLRRNELFKKVLPSKMFEAMAMRKPIVLGVEGEARQLLEAANAGIAMQPENAPELAAAVVKLVGDPVLAAQYGASGEVHVRRHFDRIDLAARYLTLLAEAAHTKRRLDVIEATAVTGTPQL
jgi:glycosyltransferase involved in cell wall biosynthesis